MKILFLTEGGGNIGFGHITRCIALCEAFKEKHINSEILVNGENGISGLIKHINFKIYNWIKNREKIFSDTGKSDFIVIDSYLAEKSIYDRFSEITDGKILMIDDYNRIDYPKGIIVNPSICGDKLDYLRKNDAIYLLGKDYIILRKEFWNIPEKSINKEVKNVLITFGGMNNYDLANKIADFLKKEFYIKIYIVDSRNNKLTAKEMLNLMLKSDICISGGGQTTYELARVGVPVIGLCLAENQKFNLTGWESLGFIKDLFWINQDENLIEGIYNSFVNLQSYEKRKKLYEIGRRYVDGQGAKNIIKKIVD